MIDNGIQAEKKNKYNNESEQFYYICWHRFKCVCMRDLK